MIARHGEHSCAARGGGSSSTPSTSSTATRRDPAYALEALRVAAEAGRRGRRRSATPTAACCPPRCRTSSPTSLAVDQRPARHPLPQRHRLRGRQLAGRGRGRRDARPGHGQRVRRAHRQRRHPHRRRQPPAQAGHEVVAARAAPRGDPDRARDQRGRPTCRRTAGSRTSGVERLRAQGRPARQRPQGRPEPLPAHRPAAGRQRHAHARLRHGRPGQHRAQGPRARARPRRPTTSCVGRGHRPRSRTSSCAGTPSRPPTRRSSCCCATRCPGATLTYFDVESWRVIIDAARRRRSPSSEATVKLAPAASRLVATGEGNGPVNALDHALRQALAEVYPEIDKLELIDFRVRILDASHGTDAVTRVLIETSATARPRGTPSASRPNIIEASWEALLDAITFGLLRHEVPVR